MYISRKKFNEKCRSDLIFWIDPNNIRLTRQGRFLVTKTIFNKILLATKRPSALKKVEGILVHDRFEPFNVPSFFLEDPDPIECEPKFQRVQDAIVNRNQIRSSAWFKNLLKSLEEDGVAVHKDLKMHSETDLIRFFDTYFFDIVDSMKQNGYRIDKLDDPNDITGVKIGANGELIKSSGGSHRLFISQIIQLPSIPVYVNGVHQQFLTNLGIRFPHRNIESITEEINMIMESHI